MSLPDFDRQIELLGLQGQRETLFESNDRYRIFAEKVYPILVNARVRLEACYCADNGRPAVEPVLVLGVSLLQFTERLPDRQALEHLRYHVGWKVALGQELDSTVFDPTVLVRFRQRLLEHQKERVIFEEVLAALETEGLMTKRGSQQRLDSTHVLGLVKRMSSLDCVREALRLALQVLAQDTVSGRPEFWAMLWERYVENSVDYRAGAEVVAKKLIQAGEDGQALLEWLGKSRATKSPKSADAIELLRKIWAENFVVTPAAAPMVKAMTGESRIENPHDPDASYRAKGKDKRWVGYAIQVAEALPVDEKGELEKGTGFLTSMESHTARGSDAAGMGQTFAAQEAMGFEKPKTLFVDTAYVSAEGLAEAAGENRELIGPVMPSHAPKKGYSVEMFRVDIATRKAVCPAGQTSTQCSRIEDHYNEKVEYRFEWSWKCGTCVLREKCLGSKQVHRTIRVWDNFMYLQARRDEIKTDAFKERMKYRAGIEGSISELVRGYGLRHARYRGLPKMSLQGYFIGAACNIQRWIRKIIVNTSVLGDYYPFAKHTPWTFRFAPLAR